MSQIDIVEMQPWIALVFGLLILAVPRILNYLVASYLIIIGVAGLMVRYGLALGS